MKIKMKSYVLVLTCITSVFLAFPVFAANDAQDTSNQNSSQKTGHRYDQQENGQNNSQSEERQRRKPPQEAINACNGKSDGDKVEFEAPRGEIVSGTCVKKGDLFFAIPEGGHSPPKGNTRQ